jgi:hypothetical protein
MRIATAALVLCMAPADAFAYVDPGSGLLLIQGLLALIGGIIVFVKNPVAAVKRLWARIVSRTKPRDR